VVKMKGVILFVVLLLGCSHNSYSEEFTLEKTERFFAYPKEIEGRLSSGEKYFSPAVDIYALWQMAGITPEPLSEREKKYLFEYPIVGQDSWYLKYPETKLYASENLKVLRIGSLSRVVTSDYQFLFFRRKGGDWVYFDNIYAVYQKYVAPEMFLTETDLFYTVDLAASGTGALLYNYNFFTINNHRVEKLFSLPQKGHVSGWGMIFDRSFSSDIGFKDNVLSIEYDIVVSMGDIYNYQQGLESDAEQELFAAKRAIFFNYDGVSLKFDEVRSQIHPEDLEKLFPAGEEGFYLMFKDEFDSVEHAGEAKIRWFGEFMRKVGREQSEEKTQKSTN
jgi:hypothetical protein